VRGYGVRLSGAQKTRGQDGRAPNLPKGARASTPTETTLQLNTATSPYFTAPELSHPK